MAGDNKSLGRFILSGIPPAPRGIPQIEVTLDIDANGILNVTAKDKATNKEQKITIQGGTGLDKDEVERMIREAETHANDDKKRKEEVETRNLADSLCYTAEKALKDAGDKVSEDIKKSIEDKVKDIRDNLQTASVENLKQKTKDLSDELQKIGQSMYESQQNNPQDKGPENNTRESDEEPVEGEVVEDK